MSFKPSLPVILGGVAALGVIAYLVVMKSNRAPSLSGYSRRRKHKRAHRRPRS
jgi:hypothetical protein